MNLAAIVAGVFDALPDGLSGTCTLSRTVGGTVARGSDARSGASTQTMTALPCVVDSPDPDRLLPTGLTREHAREVSIPAASCVTFAPAAGQTLTVGGIATTVLEVTPVDPSGAAPALYVCLVKW